MRKAVWLTLLITSVTVISACTGKGNNQPITSEKSGQKAIANDSAIQAKELAFKFLQGVQSGDKAGMYAASNLTTDMVDTSREKLVHASKYKQTETERKGSEEILRISGNIDYFGGKLRKLFPKSAGLQITQSKPAAGASGVKAFDHTITVTYNDKTEAPSDKTGKQVKSMIVHLTQSTSSIENREINSFFFDSKSFEKFAAKDFEVVSYY